MQDKTWTTLEGRVIPFKELGNRHLDNCIAMVIRAINYYSDAECIFFDEDDVPDINENYVKIEILDLQLKSLKSEKRRRIKEGSYEKPIKKWDYTILKEGVKNA